MCTRPINIDISKRSHYLRYYGIASAYVPCGHCAECQSLMQDSWFVRAYDEYCSNASLGGRTLFLTFTYDEDNVSWFYDDDDAPLFRCFDHTDKNRFLNSFRKDLERHGFTKTFKYFWCSEMGKNSTQRPHYHVLLYLPLDVWNYVSNHGRYSELRILRYFKRFWKHGFLTKGEGGLCVNGVAGVKYVAKYVTKDMLDSVSDAIRLYIGKGEREDWKERKAKISCYLPKHFQSIGFGAGLCRYFDGVELCSSKIADICKNGVIFVNDGKTQHIPFPRYVLNKVFYNRRLDNTLELNELGLCWQYDTLSSRIDDKIKKYKTILNYNLDILKNVDNPFCDDLCTPAFALLPFVRQILDDDERLAEISAFKVLFSGRYLRATYFDSILSTYNSGGYQSWIKLIKWVLYNHGLDCSYSDYSVNDYLHIPNQYVIFDDNFSDASDLEYQGFILDYVLNVLRDVDCSERKKEYDRKKLLKDFANNLKYHNFAV